MLQWRNVGVGAPSRSQFQRPRGWQTLVHLVSSTPLSPAAIKDDPPAIWGTWKLWQTPFHPLISSNFSSFSHFNCHNWQINHDIPPDPRRMKNPMMVTTVTMPCNLQVWKDPRHPSLLRRCQKRCRQWWGYTNFWEIPIAFAFCEEIVVSWLWRHIMIIKTIHFISFMVFFSHF